LGSLRTASRHGPTPLGWVVEALEKAARPARAPQHTAAAGETLEAVAKQYGFSTAVLQRLNGSLPAGELPEGTPVKLPKRPRHVVRRAQSLERIVAMHYRGLELTNNDRERLIDDIVSLNRERYPRMTRDAINRGWVLTLPAREEVVSDRPGEVPLPSRRPDRGAAVYSVRKGDTPLEIIGKSYRLAGGARLNAQQRHQILELTASSNGHLRGMRTGRIRSGDTIRLPGVDAVRAATSLEVDLVVQRTPSVAGVEDVSPLAHAVGREHRVRTHDSFHGMVRDNYVYSSSKELTAADQDRIAGLTQRLNPSQQARRLRPGTVVSLPSREAIKQQLGIDVSLRPVPKVDSESHLPVDPKRYIERMSAATAAIEQATGLPPSVAIAHAILASAWKDPPAGSDNLHRARTSRDDSGAVSAADGADDKRSTAPSGVAGSPREVHERFLGQLLTDPTSRALLEKVARDHDATAFVIDLDAAGFFSDPAEAPDIIGLMKQYELGVYDGQIARSAEVDPRTAAERKAWLESSLTAKGRKGGFLPREPETSAVGVPFPKWLDIRSFMTTHGLASADGKPISELTGVTSQSLRKGSAEVPRLGETKSRVFVVHETVGEGVYASLEAFRKGAKKDTRVNMFIGRRPGDYYVGRDFEISRSGAKRFNNASKGFVSVELVTQLNNPTYTDSQYEALARAYIMASYRAGRMLQVVPHREIDRGVPGGHNDPRSFDWERFYGTVNRMLGLPESTTYGVLQERAKIGNQKAHRTPRYDPERGLDIYGKIGPKPARQSRRSRR
jgi:flagellum-specific peptidoglycan hydrolase FlgJ